MNDRLSVSTYILDLSYRLISHYDSKSNQLLTIIGIDFAVIGFILNGFFSNIEKLADVVKWSVIIFCIINFSLIILSLLFIRHALVPHVNTVVKHAKPKYGLSYFKDIISNLGEEEYVKILIGESNPTESKYYENNEEKAFTKCIVEDNARDIFAHAEILNIKTKYVEYAFTSVISTTIVLLISMVILAIIYMINPTIPKS